MWKNIRSALTRGLQQPESCTVVPQFMSMFFLPSFLHVHHLVAANSNTETHYSRTHIPQFKCQKVTGGFGSCYFGLSLRYLKDTWFSESANDTFIGCHKSNIQMQEQTKSFGFESFGLSVWGWMSSVFTSMKTSEKDMTIHGCGGLLWTHMFPQIIFKTS